MTSMQRHRGVLIVVLLAMTIVAGETVGAPRDADASLAEQSPVMRNGPSRAHDRAFQGIYASRGEKTGQVASNKTDPASEENTASATAGIVTVLSLAFVGLVVIARRNFGKPLERTGDITVTRKTPEPHSDASVSRQTKRITE